MLIRLKRGLYRVYLLCMGYSLVGYKSGKCVVGRKFGSRDYGFWCEARLGVLVWFNSCESDDDARFMYSVLLQ